MAGIHKILVLFCLMILLGSCNLSEVDQHEIRFNGDLEGTVISRSTNQPVWGVTIYYDYYQERNESYPEDLYYNYEFPDSTLTDSQGKFHLKNLEEQQEHIIVLRKWPGFEQLEVRITPVPQTIIRQDFFLDVSATTYTLDPDTLHFRPGEERHYFLMMNQGEKPFTWTSSTPATWINCNPPSGTVVSGDAEVIFVTVQRAYMQNPTAESGIDLTILSTGETRNIPVTAEK